MEPNSLYQLQVGRKRFALDREDVAKFESPFLSTLLDPESEFAKPSDGVYKVEVDDACFSSFLHLSRFGTLAPLANVGQYFVLEEADFWGIRDKVEGEMQRQRDELKREMGPSVYRFKNLCKEVVQAKVHNNFRESDRHGRIYCDTCGSRDYDKRWYEERGHYDHRNRWCQPSARKYTNCLKCEKEVKFKLDLGWCHKCSFCKDCQAAECPNDHFVGCGGYPFSGQKPPTTKELVEELAKAEEQLYP